MSAPAPSMSQAEASRELNRACYNGEREDALALLAQGADPRWRGDSGKCALHFAAMAGHADLCSFLAQQHPDSLALRDGAGMTPLHLACRNARSEAALALCEAGADVEARDDFGRMSADCCPDAELRRHLEAFEDRRLAAQWAREAHAEALDEHGPWGLM